MEKVHKVVSAISQSPLANTVRTLFDGDSVTVPSTPGKRDGSVNCPEGTSKERFQCGFCEKI